MSFSLSLKQSLGLYIHIPYCIRKCLYCDFDSSPAQSVPDKYISSLLTEAVPYSGTTIDTIFIGGGTPSLLAKDQIIRLSDGIRNIFKVSTDAEFTIEANPGTLDKEKLQAYKDAGINRLSLGAQSFDDKELKLLGRIHSSKEIYDAYDLAIKSGFTNINIDLIFALPGQTVEQWKNTLNKAVKLDPTHISAYNLQIEEGTPFGNTYGNESNLNVGAGRDLPLQNNVLPLPDNDIEFQMYADTIQFLKSHGFIHYEISNFSKPGYECKHNLNYWKTGDWIGIGKSAASHFSGKASLKEEISQTMFMGLRLLEGIDLNEFEKRFGISCIDRYKDETNELVSTQLIEIKNNRLKLTEKGLYLANLVFEKFV